MVQCSKDPALYDRSLDIIYRFFILVQCSKDPDIYDRSLDIIYRFFILVQCSKDPALYDKPFWYNLIFDFCPKVQRSSYSIVLCLVAFYMVLMVTDWIYQPGVKKLILCTAWPHKHPRYPRPEQPSEEHQKLVPFCAKCSWLDFWAKWVEQWAKGSKRTNESSVMKLITSCQPLFHKAQEDNTGGGGCSRVNVRKPIYYSSLKPIRATMFGWCYQVSSAADSKLLKFKK